MRTTALSPALMYLYRAFLDVNYFFLCPTAVEVFAEMKGLLDASMVKKVKAIFQWDINIGGKVQQWTVDLKNGEGELYDGTCSVAGEPKREMACDSCSTEPGKTMYTFRVHCALGYFTAAFILCLSIFCCARPRLYIEEARVCSPPTSARRGCGLGLACRWCERSARTLQLPPYAQE